MKLKMKIWNTKVFNKIKWDNETKYINDYLNNKFINSIVPKLEELDYVIDGYELNNYWMYININVQNEQCLIDFVKKNINIEELIYCSNCEEWAIVEECQNCEFEDWIKNEKIDFGDFEYQDLNNDVQDSLFDDYLSWKSENTHHIEEDINIIENAPKILELIFKDIYFE